MRRSRRFWALAATASCAAVASASFAPGSPAGGAGAAPATVKRPQIRADHVDYGDRRRRQMAAYSKRHYGEREWRLGHPRVIVLHFTGSGSYSSVWTTFDSNAPNMGELPGVCSHYVIEQDGTIDELVPPRTRCRHAIGLNHVAIGIEMVQETGRGAHWADQQILHRGPQIRAALALVRWLQGRHAIPTGEVIGHAMANDDPHFEDREGWTNDHTDWLKRDVREFRERLKRR